MNPFHQEGVAKARNPTETSSIDAGKRWPLAVHIVYEQQPISTLDKAETQSETFALNLYSRLSSGDRAARVPVRLWRHHYTNGESQAPLQLTLEHASKNVVVVLVDQTLFERRTEWRSYINTLVSEARPDNDIILPVAIQADAARVATSFEDVNHIVVQDPVKLAEDERIYQAVYTALLRLLVGELPKVFLCHAKMDGTSIAKRIRQYIYEQTQLACFFDMHDIPHGHRVKKSIEESIEHSVVLAIWSDRLLDSPWCQFEIIQARRQQRPILVLDALTTKTPRLFPFLGNMPVVRWKNDAAAVVSAMLLELIRAYHLEAIFKRLVKNEKDVPAFGLHPPDLLDTHLTKANSPCQGRSQSPAAIFVYPDPPLKPSELETYYEMLPGRRCLSLIEWQALRAANALYANWDLTIDQRPNPLRGIRIGISVSSSDDWTEMGLSAKHQDDLAFDLALQLILLGAKVIWGGDLRPEGFGSQLKWIVQTYQHPSHPSQDHVAMFSPFSLVPERRLDRRAVSARRLFADVKLMECPVSLEPSVLANISATSSQGRAITAFALSAMRSELAQECQARILLGGGLKSFQGLYPGITEEAFETVKVNRPLYIIGGYGGAANALFDTIADRQSSRTAELLRVSHKLGAAACEDVRSAHAAYIQQAQRPELAFRPEEMVDVFSKLGLAGLSKCNGLSQPENRRLSMSQDIHEILELIVKGLAAVNDRGLSA